MEIAGLTCFPYIKPDTGELYYAISTPQLLQEHKNGGGLGWPRIHIASGKIALMSDEEFALYIEGVRLELMFSPYH